MGKCKCKNGRAWPCLGYKAAWFARLAPDSLVVCMDFSDAIFSATERYQDYPNIVFVKGDIANTGLIHYPEKKI